MKIYNAALKAMMETKLVSVACLMRSPYNPKTRTDNVDDIHKELERDGQLNPIGVVLINGKYAIGDGNRRFEGLKKLGRETALVTIFTPDDGDLEGMLDRIFVAYNIATKAFNGRDRLNVALQGGPTFDANTKSAKLQVENLFLDPAMRQMVIDNEITTTLLNLAKKSTKYVLGDVDTDTPLFQARYRNHVMYLLRNDAQQPLRQYMKAGHDAAVLKKAIDNNRPVPRTSSQRTIETWNK